MDLRHHDALALTFDDGPHPTWTPRVLAALERAQATATFFVLAHRAATHPELVAAMLSAGHAVELHGFRHVRHPRRSAEELATDTRCALAVLGGLGVHPRRWRLPWGEAAACTSALATEHGLTVTGWTEDTHDWRGDSAATMLDAVEGQLASGSVVLMHDGLGPGARRTTCAETVRLVEPLVRRARDAGLRVAQLPEPGGAGG